MTTYRFRLDTITCNAKASPDQYADTLTITLIASRGIGADAETIGSRGVVLGGRGNRIDTYFHPGGAYQFANPGIYKDVYGDWTLEWDMAEDDPRDMTVTLLVTNDRGIEDPYALSKLLLSLGLAGAVGAAGGFAGKTFLKEVTVLVATLGGAVGGVAAEGLKKLSDLLKPEWPDCAPLTVYRRTWAFDRAQWAREVGNHRVPSEPLDAPPDACGKPDYVVDLTVEVDAQFTFKMAEKPTGSTWISMPVPGRGDWFGDFYDRAAAPDIAVSISPSFQGDMRTYRVAIIETVGNAKRVVVDGTFDPITEVNLMVPPWNGSVAPAEVPAGQGPMIGGKKVGQDKVKNQRDGQATVFGGGGFGQQATKDRPGGAVFRGQGAMGGVPPGPGGVVGGAVPLDKLAIGSRIASATLESMTAAGHRMRLPLGAALKIPEEGITLWLYELEETYANGGTRNAKAFIRFIRTANGTATAADLILARYSLLR